MPEPGGWLYRCKVCRSTKRVDLPRRELRSHPLDGRGKISVTYLYERDGQLYERPPREWAPICCDRPMKGDEIQSRPGKLAKCGRRCIEAVGSTCACPCGGKNHGAAYRISSPEN